MEKIYLKARAKVNLSLNVLEKRPDNYHNLESIFQKINLYDEIWIEKISDDKFELNSNIKGVKLEDNIVYKAYYKLKEKFPNISGVRVTINKKIPMQAGLAGGSTDCASFLIGMKKLYSLNFPEKDIVQLASSLGADVAPCLYGGIIKGEKIGDEITLITSDLKYYLVIIKPRNIFCSTKDMFMELDKRTSRNVKNTDKIVEAIQNKDIYMLANNLYNDFEVVSNEIEEINEAKEVLRENGALGVLLSGAGSCVFGIFENKEKAKLAYEHLKDNYETYICLSYNKRREI